MSITKIYCNNNSSENLCLRQHQDLSDEQFKQSFYRFAEGLKKAITCRGEIAGFITHALEVLERHPEWEQELRDALVSPQGCPSQFWLHPQLFALIEERSKNQESALKWLEIYPHWSHVDKVHTGWLVNRMIERHDAIANRLWDALIMGSCDPLPWNDEEKTTLCTSLLLVRKHLISEAVSLIRQWNVPSSGTVLLELAGYTVADQLCNTYSIWGPLVSEEVRISVVECIINNCILARQFLHNSWNCAWATPTFHSHILRSMIMKFPIGMGITLTSSQGFEIWTRSVDPETRLFVFLRACPYRAVAQKILTNIFGIWKDSFTLEQQREIIAAIMEQHGPALCRTLFTQLETDVSLQSVLTPTQWTQILLNVISSVDCIRLNYLSLIVELLIKGRFPREVIPDVIKQFFEKNIHLLNHPLHYLFNTLLSHMPSWHDVFADHPDVQRQLRILFIQQAPYATDVQILHTWLSEGIVNSNGHQSFFYCELQHHKQWDLTFLDNWHRGGLIPNRVYIQLRVATRTTPLNSDCINILFSRVEPIKRSPRLQTLVLGHASELTRDQLIQLGIDKLSIEINSQDLSAPLYLRELISLTAREEVDQWPIVQALTREIQRHLPQRAVFHNLVTSPVSLVSDAVIRRWLRKMQGIHHWFFYMALLLRHRPLILTSRIIDIDYCERISIWDLKALRQAVRHELPPVPRCCNYRESMQQLLQQLPRDNFSEHVSPAFNPRRQLVLLSQYLDDPTQPTEGLTWHPNPEQLEDMKKIFDHCAALLQENQTDILGILASYLGTVFLNCSSGKQEAIFAIYNALYLHYNPLPVTLKGFIGDLIARAKEEFFQQFADEEANDQFPLANHQNTHWMERARAILSPYIGGTFAPFDNVEIPSPLRMAVVLTFMRSFSLSYVVNYLHRYLCENDERIEQCRQMVEQHILQEDSSNAEAQYNVFEILYGMSREDVDSYYNMSASSFGESTASPTLSLKELFKRKVNIEKILVLCGFIKSPPNSPR